MRASASARVPDSLRILRDCAGTQFAPEVVDAMERWVAKVGRDLGKNDLTKHDLLHAETPWVVAT